MRFLVNLLFGFVLCIISGCQTSHELPKDHFQFLIEEDLDSQKSLWNVMVRMPVSGAEIEVCANPVLLESDIESVKIVDSSLGKCLVFQLKRSAAISFYKLSIGCENRKLVLVLNGEPIGISTPIQGPVADGNILVFVEYEEDKLENLAYRIHDVIVKLKALKEQ